MAKIAESSEPLSRSFVDDFTVVAECPSPPKPDYARYGEDTLQPR